MKVLETGLAGVILLEPTIFRDDRGYFLETYNNVRYEAIGLRETFVQDNISWSRKGVLRGLHYQHPRAQGKLITVLWGEVYDVAVDIRRGSPTYGRHVGTVLSSDNMRQMFVPRGFAHGFLVLSEGALFSYKCTEYYQPTDEGSVLWSDPDLQIEWPVSSPILAPKDAGAPHLADIPDNRLPRF
jgi:dTDP-4-dehydrorhamnose 3,5-epimerase